MFSFINFRQVFKVDQSRCHVLSITIIRGRGITRGKLKDWCKFQISNIIEEVKITFPTIFRVKETIFFQCIVQIHMSPFACWEHQILFKKPSMFPILVTQNGTKHSNSIWTRKKIVLLVSCQRITNTYIRCLQRFW